MSNVEPRTPAARVELRTTPPGARVLDGKKLIGTTPLTVTLSPGKEVTYRLVLAGHRPALHTVKASDREVNITLNRLPARNHRAHDDLTPPDDLKADPF